jgi:hypothetical protein
MMTNHILLMLRKIREWNAIFASPCVVSLGALSNVAVYFIYEGYSNENLKSAIKIQNTARLSCKLTIMILMVLRMADKWQYDVGMQRDGAAVV